MFRKKKKQLETQITREFKIPQFDNSTHGLMMNKRKFSQTPIASPIFGTQIKDELYAPDQQGMSDVKLKYENFRPENEKKVSEEELLAKYGTKYYEFTPLTNRDKREFYGSDVTVKPQTTVIKSEVKKSGTFSFINDRSTYLTNSSVSSKKQERAVENPSSSTFSNFSTFENSNKKATNHLDSLDEFELNSFDSKPTTRSTNDLPSFLQTASTGNGRINVITPSTSSTNINSSIIEKNFEDIKPQNSYAAMEDDFNSISSSNIDAYFDDEEEIEDDFNTSKNEVEDKEVNNYTNTYINQSNNNVFNQMQSKQQSSNVLLSSDGLYSDYELPSSEMFAKSTGERNENFQWAEEKKELINGFLKSFQVGGEVVNYTVGPTLSRFEIALNTDQNVKKIANLRDTIQMHLAVKTLRILAPIPGKSTVGLEIPNMKSEDVYFGDIINNEFYSNESLLNVALGKDIDDVGIYTQIDTMPHGLIAGSTGAGKSVCINTILASLLLRNTPDDLKLILIDPKQVELIYYDELPHLITPVIDDPYMASESLKWATEEMERRYQTLKNNRVRNIKEYNKKSVADSSIKKMPYIVIVIDELADLMMKCASEVEDSIQLLAQKSRAAGIHLLVATQRPTVDVIKGNIKANIPSRVAFKVVSGTDSQTILDEHGAEQLLGRGDMLVKQNDIPHRLQGAYISDDEILKLTEFIKEQVQPNYLFTHEHLKQQAQSSNLVNPAGHSESPATLYNVAKFFFEEKNCSINKVQSYFNYGFNRAQRIVKTLEEMEVIAKKSGNQFHEPMVSINDLAQFFNQ